MSPVVPSELLDPVVAYFKPRRVIPFGSQARGEGDRDSDFDLIVVLDDEASPEKLSAKAIAEARAGYPGAVDIIPCRASHLYSRARAIGSFAHLVLRDGVPVL